MFSGATPHLFVTVDERTYSVIRADRLLSFTSWRTYRRGVLYELKMKRIDTVLIWQLTRVAMLGICELVLDAFLDQSHIRVARCNGLSISFQEALNDDSHLEALVWLV